MTISSHAAIGWHLWGSVKKSVSDSTQVPKGVAGDWEKDNVGGSRRAVVGVGGVKGLLEMGACSGM